MRDAWLRSTPGVAPSQGRHVCISPPVTARTQTKLPCPGAHTQAKAPHEQITVPRRAAPLGTEGASRTEAWLRLTPVRGVWALGGLCRTPGPLPESGLEPLGTAAHWLQVVKTGKRYTAPGCRGGTVHSPRTLLLLQGAPSQRAGCFILRPLQRRAGAARSLGERGWQRLREGRPGLRTNGEWAAGLAAPLAEPPAAGVVAWAAPGAGPGLGPSAGISKANVPRNNGA